MALEGLRREMRRPLVTHEHEVDWNNATAPETITWRSEQGWEMVTASHRIASDTWDLFWKRKIS